MICKLGIHKWTKWSEPVQAYINDKTQWRVCKKCHKANSKILKYDHQTELKDMLPIYHGFIQAIEKELK